MKILNNMIIAIIVLILSLIMFVFSIFSYNLSSVSDDDTLKEVVIEPGSIDMIADKLYKNDLIKSEFFFKVYVRLTGKTNLKAATYELSEDMGVRKIVEILEDGSGKNTSEISITFKEGINMRTVASLISESTVNTEEDVYNRLKDKEYLKNLINKYWFLEEIILSEDIYYSLEGYLYPNTYSFVSTEVSVDVIIDAMLDEMEKKLTPYKDIIASSGRSVHEIITLASITELEGTTKEEREYITSVFVNRINSNMTLGSDVTTYYGAMINMGDRDLYASEVDACNNYNTRCSSFLGLPISPISNPSLDSILSVIEPVQSDYYFVADKNKKVYFSKSLDEHNNTIYKLKQNDLWYEY